MTRHRNQNQQNKYRNTFNDRENTRNHQQYQPDRDQYSFSRTGRDDEYDQFSRDRSENPTQSWNHRFNSERNYPSGSNFDFQDQGNFGYGSGSNYGSRERNQDRFGQSQDSYSYGSHSPYNYQNQNRYGQQNREDSTIQNYSGWGTSSDSDSEYEGSRRGSPSQLGNMYGLNREYSSKGRFSGTTPKNFKRSDERIYDEICDRLSQGGHFDVSDVEIKVEDGEVTLEGSLDNRSDKHRIEMLADSVMGVKEITNQIKIKNTKGASSSSDSENSRSGSSTNKPRSIGSTSNR